MDDHSILHDEKSIFIDYAFAINVENTKTVTNEVIRILEKSNHPMNVVVDVNNSHLTDNNAIAVASKLLKPFKKRINTLYIIGASGFQKILLQTLFKLVGGKNSKHFKNLESIEDVKIDIEFCWKHYLEKH